MRAIRAVYARKDLRRAPIDIWLRSAFSWVHHIFRPARGSRSRRSPPPPPVTALHPVHGEASEQTACANDDDFLEDSPLPSPGSPAPHRATEHTSPTELDLFDVLEGDDNHMQIYPTDDHSPATYLRNTEHTSSMELDQFDIPERDDNRMLDLPGATSFSTSADTHTRPTSDHSQPDPVDSGVILLPRTDSSSATTDSHTRPTSDHSQPNPVGSGVMCPCLRLCLCLCVCMSVSTPSRFAIGSQRSLWGEGYE